MMMIRRIGVLSVGKLTAVLYGAMGLLFGAIITLFSLVGMASNGGDGIEGMIFGTAAVVVLPLFYGIIGALFAMFAAVIYNFAAGLVGGIEIELEGFGGQSAGGPGPL